MKTKKVILFDGQALDRTKHEYLYQFHNKGEADIFNMYNSMLVLKFVGYIEFIQNNILHELYCFPKEYNVRIDSANISHSQELTEEQAVQAQDQFKVVIKSIIKAAQAEASVSQNDMNKFYASNLHYLNEIIGHYNQYGILVEVEKEYRQAPTGKINWNKTIGKIIPKTNNCNFIYDKFVVEKKNTNITFLTQMIAKVILEGTTKYSFYTPIIDTGIDYGQLIGISNKVAITRLYELKNSTFKDYLHHVIDNLISYLQNDTVTSNSGVLVGTNNYNFVWEHVIAHGLGTDFEKAKNQTIGTYYNYERKTSKVQIELDHVNSNNHIIVDSKYYNDREGESIDYKQLYYNYHQVYLSSNSDSDKTYSQIMDEYKKWKNVLIKPTREHSDLFSVFILDDGMKLYSLKINAAEYINYYVDNTFKSKLSIETQDYLNLEVKVRNLKLSME